MFRRTLNRFLGSGCFDGEMGAVAYDRKVVLNTVDASSAPFDAFIADAQVRLRRAFVARYGVDLGVEACSESITWAYANRERLMGMTNPVGYLYRVGNRRPHPGAVDARSDVPGWRWPTTNCRSPTTVYTSR